LTTKIVFGKVCGEFAGPVDLGDDFTDLAAVVGLSLSLLGPSAISNNLVGRTLDILSNTRRVVSGLLKTNNATGVCSALVDMVGEISVELNSSSILPYRAARRRKTGGRRDMKTYSRHCSWKVPLN
jgi:hypothetical protein